jgi:hypothetical protein
VKASGIANKHGQIIMHVLTWLMEEKADSGFFEYWCIGLAVLIHIISFSFWVVFYLGTANTRSLSLVIVSFGGCLCSPHLVVVLPLHLRLLLSSTYLPGSVRSSGLVLCK